MLALRTRPSILPGFGLALGTTVLFLTLVVLIPLSGVLLKTLSLSPQQFWDVATSPRALAAYRLSFGAAPRPALPHRDGPAGGPGPGPSPSGVNPLDARGRG